MCIEWLGHRADYVVWHLGLDFLVLLIHRDFLLRLAEQDLRNDASLLWHLAIEMERYLAVEGLTPDWGRRVWLRCRHRTRDKPFGSHD